MIEDLSWRGTWYDLEGKMQTVTSSVLQSGSKICTACHTNIKPVFSCRKCRFNSCDACSDWARNKNRMITVYCPQCHARIGILI
jgi:hypothetical protein